VDLYGFVQFVFDNFDVLVVCCNINVASAVAMLHVHTAATVCSSKLAVDSDSEVIFQAICS